MVFSKHAFFFLFLLRSTINVCAHVRLSTFTFSEIRGRKLICEATFGSPCWECQHDSRWRDKGGSARHSQPCGFRFTGGCVWNSSSFFFCAEFGWVAALIRIMLVIASNSSIIERGYAALKGIKSHKYSRSEDGQLVRLLILSVNLPELSDFDIQSVVAGMPSSWYRRVQGNNFLGFYLVIFQNLYFLKLL